MFYCDYHMHTNYSMDGNASMESMIKKSIALGLKEIALTDHVDFLADGSEYPGQFDYDIYINEFNKLREKYKKDINLLLGVEIGAAPHLKDNIAKLVSKYPFEFIIASSHDIHKIEIWRDNSFFEGKDKLTAYTQYFEEVLQNIRMYDEFDVYGHIDYINRYGEYENRSLLYDDYINVVDNILIELINRGKGLEVNTSGYRYGLNQVHPQLAILKRYKELGGEIITIGSDAHNTEDICEGFKEGMQALQEAGFKAITVFRDRKPVFVDINIT